MQNVKRRIKQVVMVLIIVSKLKHNIRVIKVRWHLIMKVFVLRNMSLLVHSYFDKIYMNQVRNNVINFFLEF